MRIFTRGMQQGKESARDIAVHEDGRGKVPLRVKRGSFEEGESMAHFLTGGMSRFCFENDCGERKQLF